METLSTSEQHSHGGQRASASVSRKKYGTWSAALFIGAWLAFLAPGFVAAQTLQQALSPDQGASETEPDPSASPTDPEEIGARRDAVARELEQFTAEVADKTSESIAYREEIIQRLQRIEALLAQQASFVDPFPVLVEAGTEDQEIEPSPFTLNALMEERFAAVEAIAHRSEKLDAARSALDASKAKLDAAERNRRKARSALEEGDAAGTQAAERTLRMRALDSRIAEEEVYLRTLQVAGAKNAQAASENTERIDTRIDALRARLENGEGDSRHGFAALAEREGELRRTRKEAERRVAIAELLLVAAQNRFSAQAEPPQDLIESVEALTVRRDAIREEIALLDAQLERLATQRSIWQQWDAFLRDKATRDELETWEASALERLNDLKQRELRGLGSVSDLQHRMEAADRRLAALPADSRLRATLATKRDALGRLHLAQLAEVSALASDLRLTQGFVADLTDSAWTIDPLEFIVLGAKTIREIWGYEITTIDDAPITVGSFVLALFLFGIGLWASRRGSIFVGRVSEAKFKVDAGAAHALQTISFYVLLIGFALFSLRAVHFPLTAFTVLGGALAIGIGFGSQNVMNNFISGLILMLERPVRARDVVEVDGRNGMIEHIGARSTQIRSTDGRHVIVPNSFFLETNVVNWTLSDDLIRTKVTVGVVYGSPTRLVEELIARVVAEEKKALKNPEAIIIFSEFGDNALIFDAYFWVRARSPMEIRKVASSVRFRIDDVMREHQIVIAFPQRDVHIDSVRPIEVLVRRDEPSTPGSWTELQPDRDQGRE